MDTGTGGSDYVTVKFDLSLTTHSINRDTIDTHTPIHLYIK